MLIFLVYQLVKLAMIRMINGNKKTLSISNGQAIAF